MKKSLSLVTALAVIFAIFIFANMLFGSFFKTMRFDLTEESIYSLSKGTKNILNNLEDQVTLRYYYSKTEAVAIPFIQNYAERVEDLLHEYALTSKGKLILEVYDPRPDTEEQEWAEKFGIQPVPIQNNMSLYFGLVGTNERGDEDVIAYFDPNREELLEYDITRLIYNLNHPDKQKLGIISSLPLQGSFDPEQGMQPPWIFINELSKSYDIENLETDVKAIPEDIEVLLLLHPKNISNETLFAIDQFVLRGGRLLVFVDPYCETDEPKPDPNNPGMPASRFSNLEKLFKAWGVEMVKGKVAADQELATNVNTGRGTVPYIVWLTLKEDNINHKDIITGQLENLLLPSPGILKTTETEGITYTPILQTTKAASTVEAMTLSFSPPDTLIQRFTPGNEALTLALRITGKFKTAFPEGRPTNEENKEKKKDEKTPELQPLKESKEETNILVVADVDLLADRFSVQVQNIFGQRLAIPFNDNLNFIANSVENLSGSNDLISIRSRGKFTRPFTKVQEIEKAAESKWKDEEKQLQEKVDEINRRLQEVQEPGKKTNRQIINRAIQDEINKYRIEKSNAQKKLREVRRNLRQDKEALGNWLFLINTFLIPLLICCVGIAVYFTKKRKT